MNKAVIYARYSSDKQTEQSIEGQVRVCSEYAEENGFSVVNVYIDRAVSGRYDNREAFQRMISDSRFKMFDCVLVYKLDRFSRNKYETELYKHKLKENGVKLVSAMEKIPDSPEGTLLESLIVGMNQYYSEELAQKSLRGLRETRLKGFFLGRIAPFGYDNINRKLQINETEAEVVRFIFTLSAKGFSTRKIARKLTELGITKRDSMFKNWAINRILNKEYYTGKLTANSVVYNNIYPQLIDEKLFLAVQEQLKKNDKYKPGVFVRHPLRHKVFCGLCGNVYTTHSGRYGHGDLLRYYRCTNRAYKQKCTANPIRKEVLESAVFNALRKTLRPTKISAIAENITKICNDNFAKSINTKLFEETSFENETDAEHIKLNEKFIILRKQEVLDFFKNAMTQAPQTAMEILVKKIIIIDNKMQIYLHYFEGENLKILEEKIYSMRETQIFKFNHGRNHYSQRVFKRIVNFFI